MRGSIGHEPWGTTLASLGAAGKTGQLALHASDGKTYRIAVVHGVVVGAASPLSADAVPRIALAARMIPSALAKGLGKTDDLERIARLAELTGAQVQELKRRVIIQRAGRTFAVDAGDYELEDTITIPTLLGVEVDIRTVIYQGMRMNMSQARLTKTLRRVGTRFVLRPEAAADVSKFGFGIDEQPVLDALAGGTSLPELAAVHHGIDERMVEAVFCTLAVCDVAMPAELAPPQNITMSRAPTPREPTLTRVPTPRQPTSSLDSVPMLIQQDPHVSITRPVAVHSIPAGLGRPIKVRPPTMPRVAVKRAMTDPFLEVQATRMRPNALTIEEVRELITIGTQLLEYGVDHFTFLGLQHGASVDEVREAYLEFARYLRPEKLAELGIADETMDARSVFAQVVIAYTVLTDPVRRAEYMRTMTPARALR